VRSVAFDAVVEDQVGAWVAGADRVEFGAEGGEGFAAPRG